VASRVPGGNGGVTALPAAGRRSTARALLPLLLAAAIAAGLAYRIWIVTQARVYGDGYFRYAPIARNLLAGNGFSIDERPPYRPDTMEVPGYPALLAVIYAVSGGSTQAVALVQLLMEAGILALTGWLVLLLGGGRRAAAAAVLLGWLYPGLPAWCRETYADIAATFLAVLLLALAVRAWVRTGPASPARRALAGAVAGISAGLLGLVRADTYPLAAVAWAAVAAAGWRGGGALSARLAPAAGFLLAAAVVLAPWSVRHARLTGEWTVPGGRQYGHPSDPYLRWCETWVDDPKWVLPYMLNRGYPGKETRFPPERIPDAGERARAETAYRLWQQTGAYEGAPKEEFRWLAQEAEARRTPWSRVWLPVRRAVMVYARYPSAADTPFAAVTRPARYILWLGVLAGCAAGLRAVIRRRAWLWLLPLAFVGGRLLLPLASAAGSEIRYQYPALPVLFALAGWGWEAWATRRSDE
jgi:hypothetical protein